MKKELTITEYNELSNAVLLSIKGQKMKSSGSGSGSSGPGGAGSTSTKYIMPKESVTMWSLQGECVFLLKNVFCFLDSLYQSKYLYTCQILHIC